MNTPAKSPMKLVSPFIVMICGYIEAGQKQNPFAVICWCEYVLNMVNKTLACSELTAIYQFLRI